MKKILLLLLLLTAAAHSQTVLMHDGSETVTSGMFYDSGGPTGNYLNNENYTLTLCPSVPGKFVQLDFTSTFNMQGAPFDFLTVYEGTDDGGSVLGDYGIQSPISCRDGIITSSDPSGCLTITFESDNTLIYLGWVAAISLSDTPGNNQAAAPTAFCASSAAFCADTPLQFVNTTSADCVNTAVGNITDHTCLDTAHNPAWYYMKIQNDGNLQLQIKQTSGPNGTGTGIDVDFAIWGPFASTDDNCGSFGVGDCIANHNCSGSVVDCSWSPAAVEIATINNVHAGEIYMVLVTNFEGASGFITMTQISPGANMTDCTIACPVAQKTDPDCGSSNGFITISKLKQNHPYHITYLDNGSPVAIDLISNEFGKIVISGLDVGTYSNIMIDFAGCTDPLGPFALTAVTPQLTGLTAPSTICPGGNATFAFTGTADAIVSYNINSGTSQQLTLDADGHGEVILNSITASATLTATSIKTTDLPITGTARDAAGAENAVNAMGNMLAVGSVPTLLNSAKVNGTHATMYISLQHKVPAGTAVTLSIARDTNAANITITDGAAVMNYNTGTVDVLQRIVFVTAVATNVIKIQRIAGSVWIDAIRYSYQSLDCTRAVSNVAVVNIGSLTTAPIVTTPIIYCRDETASVLGAISLPGAALNWFGTNATGGTASSSAPTPQTADPGNTTYYVSQTINGCESVRSAIVVQVNSAAIAPTVSSTPIVYCKNETAFILTATAVPGAVLHWYGNDATGGTDAAIAPIPSTATAGTFRFYVSQSISGCESLRVAITVIVNEIPPAPVVTSPVRYCEGTVAVPLRAIALPGAVLNWYGNDATGGTASTVVPTPQTAVTGTVNYYVSQTINGCESPRAMIRVLVGVPVSPPIPDTPVTYCQGETAAALTALALPGGSLNWYGTAATGGTDSDIATIPSTSNAVTTLYYVSQTVSGCESDRIAIVVNVMPAPVAPVVSPLLSYCKNEPTAVLSATAISGAILNWYGTNATGGTASATAPTPSSAIAGTAVYYVSQSMNGCESARAAITVIIKPAASLPVVVPVVYCQGATTVVLGATAVTGGTLNWYGTSATNGIPTAIPPTPSAAVAGNTNYYVSQTIDGCESARVAIAVQIKAKPSAPAATSPVVYCIGEPAVALNANASAGGILNWYTTNSSSEIPSALAPTPSTASAGNTVYYVSQSIDGCESQRTSITVRIRSTAPPFVTPSITYCEGETPSILTANGLPGSILNWYGRNATGGTASLTAPTPSAHVVGNQTFYVSQTVAGCESARASITVSVKPLPIVALADGIICIRQSAGQVERSLLLDSGLNNAAYEFVWTLNDEIIPGENRSTLTALEAGNYTVVAKNRATGCISEPAGAVVRASFIGESVTVNGNDAFIESQDLKVIVTGSGIYEYQLDYGPFQSSNVFPGIASGSHTINVRDEYGCTNLSQSFSVIGYLHFFTPNGDGYNDVWTINGMESDPSAKLTVFDRYGKVMKIINLQNKDWDGTYEGKLLPADDYWFVMEYTEKEVKKQFRSHFSLKR